MKVLFVLFDQIASYPPYEIKEGDKVGQISLVKYDRVIWKQVKEFNREHYGNIVRSGGFGSTVI